MILVLFDRLFRLSTMTLTALLVLLAMLVCVDVTPDTPVLVGDICC